MQKSCVLKAIKCYTKKHRDRSKWKDSSCSRTRRLQSVKVTALPERICRFSFCPIIIQTAFLTETVRLILRCWQNFLLAVPLPVCHAFVTGVCVTSWSPVLRMRMSPSQSSFPSPPYTSTIPYQFDLPSLLLMSYAMLYILLYFLTSSLTYTFQQGQHLRLNMAVFLVLRKMSVTCRHTLHISMYWM